MDIMEISKIEEGQVYELVEKEVKERSPEEYKFVDELPQEVYDATWILIHRAIDRAFELAFEMGQRAAGREKPVPVRWSGEL